MQTNNDSRTLLVEEKLPITVQFAKLKKSSIMQCEYGLETLDISQRNNTKPSHLSNSQLRNKRYLMELNLSDIDFIHHAIMREGVQ